MNPALSIAEFDRILRFWFDRGVAGFRIDVAHMVVKDRELRDDPPATVDDFILDQIRGQVPVYNSKRPEVHDVYRSWRRLADGYDPSRLFVGRVKGERCLVFAPGRLPSLGCPASSFVDDVGLAAFGGAGGIVLAAARPVFQRIAE